VTHAPGTPGSLRVHRQTTTTYDAIGQITNILSKDGANAQISNLTFTFDAGRRLTQQNDSGTLVTYTYDDSSQLTADGATTVIYDTTGNRTTVTTAGGTVNYTTAAGNKLTNDGTYAYTYDAAGDMTKKSLGSNSTTWKYGYDNKDRLISAQKWSEDPDIPGTPILQLEANYQYDVFGNRSQKSVDNDGSGGGSAVVTRFAYDGWNPAKPPPIGLENFDIWGVFNGESSLTSRNFHGDRVDQPLAFVKSANAYWYLTDQLGSIRKVLDNTAVVKDAIAYDGYGNITSETDPTKRGLYSHTGRERDEETRLNNHRARYYDPETARWVSQDPLGFDAGDSNLYRYVSNRLSLATDPSGKFLVAHSIETAKHLAAWLRDDRNTGVWKHLEGPGLESRIIVGDGLFILVPSHPLKAVAAAIQKWKGDVHVKAFASLANHLSCFFRPDKNGRLIANDGGRWSYVATPFKIPAQASEFVSLFHRPIDSPLVRWGWGFTVGIMYLAPVVTHAFVGFTKPDGTKTTLSWNGSWEVDNKWDKFFMTRFRSDRLFNNEGVLKGISSIHVRIAIAWLNALPNANSPNNPPEDCCSNRAIELLGTAAIIAGLKIQ
jgi:RHS repeat-associated protein